MPRNNRVYIALTLLVIALTPELFAQQADNHFLQFYPFAETPNIRYISSYRKDEKLLFEANPTVYYSFVNNFYKRLVNSTDDTTAFAVYAHWEPHLRMYNESSKPVKTPSSRIYLGTQFLFKLKSPVNPARENFVGFMVESGHYSNGQSRGAFSEAVADQTAANDSVYALITPETNLSKILNRNSGNFSTNLTKILIGFRTYTFDDDNRPRKMHAFQAGVTHYHDKFWGMLNFGGYTEQDIEIYGKWRYHLGYEYMRVFKSFCDKNWRISFSHNIEIIQGAHPWVNPYRSETILNVFPFQNAQAFGLTFSFIAGHDNYNYHFVDSVRQFTAGITWALFPPFTMRNKLAAFP